MTVFTTPRPVVLLGSPVSHSLSPIIHNRAFELTGQPFVYHVADVRPEDLAAALQGIRSLGYRGANVTIPYKCDVIPFLDEMTAQARATNAVNTIVCENDGRSGGVRLIGDNTDIAGFLAPLEPMLDELLDQPALVIGSGGAARAVVYSLLTSVRSSAVTIAARTPARAEELVQSVGGGGGSRAEVIPLADLASAIRRSRFIINTTPVGMHPDAKRTPIPDADLFHPDHIVYDLIYRPRPTRLLRDAAARGAGIVDGLEMLLGQAAAAFIRWTGAEMPLEKIRPEVATRLA